VVIEAAVTFPGVVLPHLIRFFVSESDEFLRTADPQRKLVFDAAAAERLFGIDELSRVFGSSGPFVRH
jgi:hypothetical protein